MCERVLNSTPERANIFNTLMGVWKFTPHWMCFFPSDNKSILNHTVRVPQRCSAVLLRNTSLKLSINLSCCVARFPGLFWAKSHTQKKVHQQGFLWAERLQQTDVSRCAVNAFTEKEKKTGEGLLKQWELSVARIKMMTLSSKYDYGRWGRTGGTQVQIKLKISQVKSERRSLQQESCAGNSAAWLRLVGVILGIFSGLFLPLTHWAVQGNLNGSVRE